MEDNKTINGILDTFVDYFGGDRVVMMERYFKGDKVSFYQHLKKQYKVFVNYYNQAIPMEIKKNKTGAASVKKVW